MLKASLRSVEEKIAGIDGIPSSSRDELVELLRRLEAEADAFGRDNAAPAESVAGFLRVSSHEATRRDRNARLLDLALEGLAASVREFEASHPRLVETVNAICEWFGALEG